MIKIIRQLSMLIPKATLPEFFFMQALVIISAALEVIGLLTIAPVLSIATNPTYIADTPILQALYTHFEFESHRAFLITLSGLVITLLAFSFAASVAITWWLAMFSARLGAEFGNRLYDKYLGQPWLYHAAHNSSDMIKKVTIECDRVAMGVIMPLMIANSRLLVGIMTSVALALVDPIMSLTIVVLFSTSYILIFRGVRGAVSKNGAVITRVNGERQKLLAEGFGGIKNILLRQLQPYYSKQFVGSGRELARAKGQNQGIKSVPRFFLEFLVYAGVIGVVLYQSLQQGFDLTNLVPTLSLFGLATLKLLPAFQGIYGNLTSVHGNRAALDEIVCDLTLEFGHEMNGKDALAPGGADIAVVGSIVFDKVSFEYNGLSKFVINSLTAEIPIGQTIGIVGQSGSGKSTFADLLMGLIAPNSGEITVGGKAIDDANRQSWCMKMGFVPQDFYLSEATIAENIAFGQSLEAVDMTKIEVVGGQAALDEMVKHTAKGYLESVGERGVQLSGGQRQRIGIARALYLDAEVLILDEATSALDAITESQIMKVVKGLKGKKTIIIIAHKLDTLKSCDKIFLMDQGKILDAGTYQELSERSQEFNKLVG